MARTKSNAADKAFSLIANKIEKYELSPGDYVSDLELSKQLDMSRTPVREAILQLLNFGLLERENSRIVVKAITLNDAVEMLQVREAIEKMSVKIIINNNLLTEDRKNEITNVESELVKSINDDNLYDNYKFDDMFHRKIVEFSGNSRLLETFDRVDIQGRRLRWITVLTPDRFDNTCKEHAVILESIQNNDIQAAEAAVESHIQNTMTNYKKILESQHWERIILTLKHLTQ